MLIIVFIFSLLVVVVNDSLGCCDLDLGGLIFASLVFVSLAVAQDTLGHNLHVDRCLLSLPSWL
jgi:hypothetical protein